MLAGDGGVGKTALAHTYVSGTFKEDTRMTLGAEFHVKHLTCKDTSCALQLWDLGGEPRFRFMLASYCIGAHGALLLFDTTRFVTLISLREWVNEVLHKVNPKLPFLVCGTKIDLEKGRSVPTNEGQDYAASLSAFGYTEVSALTGLNVDKVFGLILEQINA